VEHFLTHTVAANGYLAVFLLMAVSSACIPIPSEIVMVFGGALASAGFAQQALHDPSRQLEFWLIVGAGLGGGMLGSWLAYGLGFAGGRPLIDRWGRYLLLRPHEVERAHVWFEDHGEAAVFFSRMLPVVRAFISLPAGVARMSLWRFSAYTLLGSLPWTIGLAWAGFLLGGRWRVILRYFTPISIAFAVLLVGLVAWWAIRRARTRRRVRDLLDPHPQDEPAPRP